MKDVRCMLGFHRYVTQQMDEGSGTYRQCRRCQNVQDSEVDLNAFRTGMQGMNNPLG